MKWGLKLIFYVNVLLVVLTLFAYISPFVDPQITWFFSFFGLGYPILLLLNILFILFWVLVKPKYLSLSLITLALGYNAIFRAVGFNFKETETSGLKIMSYNIGHSGYYFKDKKDEKKIQDFKRFIESESPDIICLQERRKSHLEIYENIFSDYELYPNEFIGTCIYTKHKILDSGNLYFDTNAHNATWVDLEYQGKKIRIYSIHLSSNKVKNLTDNYKEIWDESKFILNKYNAHAVIRTKQLTQILDHAATSRSPLVITGDFNDVPQSYLYRMISEKYTDAFLGHGKGMVKTHNSSIPGLRIDYVFHSDDLQTSSHRIRKVKFSDHYPLISVLDLN